MSDKANSPHGTHNPNHGQQQKWDRRYQDALAPNSPAAVLNDNRHLLPGSGRALEIACGLGGNSLLLAEQGLQVEAFDLSPVAIAKLQGFARLKGLSVEAQVRNLEHEQLPANRYQVICVSAFLDRNLCPAIQRALAPGGLLFYQTFTQEKVARESTPPRGPSNPDFLLKPGELLQLFADLQPLAYREECDCGDVGQGLRNQAYLIARRVENQA